MDNGTGSTEELKVSYQPSDNYTREDLYVKWMKCKNQSKLLTSNLATLKQVSKAKYTKFTVTDRKLKNLQVTTDKVEKEVDRLEKSNQVLKGKYDDEVVKHKAVIEAHKKALDMKDRAEYRAVTMCSIHQTDMGVLQIKVERLEIAESNSKSVITRLEGDVRKLENKGKEYDKLFLQGIKNMMQMKTYGEHTDIR